MALSNALQQWLGQHQCCAEDFLPLAGDASMRQFYKSDSHVLMLSPIDAIPLEPYLKVQALLVQQHIPVARITASSHALGAVLMQNLGDTLLLDIIKTSPQTLYEKALSLCADLTTVDASALPRFDQQAIKAECDLFPIWYCQQLHQQLLTPAQLNTYHHALAEFYKCFSAQPQTFVHRDYHSRNIMLQNNGELAVIDFQDAVCGPITYDCASLLKDCYIQWPLNQIKQWAEYALEQLKIKSLLHNAIPFNTFWQWLEITGLQRHIKVLGIFARLSLRDGKHQFLDDIPLVREYVLEVTSRYPQFNELHYLIKCIK